MKMFLTLLSALTVGLTVYAQSAGSAAMESQIRRGLLDSRNQGVITTRSENPNEIRRGEVSYEGVIVQFIKSDNKLQLINPAAPPQYGSGRDNLVSNPGPESGSSPARGDNGHQGLKLFSIRF